jgi:hypothetical protein
MLKLRSEPTPNISVARCFALFQFLHLLSMAETLRAGTGVDDAENNWCMQAYEFFQPPTFRISALCTFLFFIPLANCAVTAQLRDFEKELTDALSKAQHSVTWKSEISVLLSERLKYFCMS